jgi:hypothetical protein
MSAVFLVMAMAGCGRQPAPPNAPAPAVTFQPREMADALHAVIAADQKTYAWLPGDESQMALHARKLREASAAVQQDGAEFHYVLRSLWPINPKNGPETETEKNGLRFVIDHPGTNYYGEESLGGRRYFTAVYADAAALPACVDCHNRDPRASKRDFKAGEVMGGYIVRVPLEF